MAGSLLIRKVHQEINNLLAGLPDKLYFHNRQHTEHVFLAATEIALLTNLPQNEILPLQLAALFHDTGYLYDYSGHEEKSKLIAATFLLQNGCSGELIDAVTTTIEATRVPQQPQNSLQRIICDADLFHLSQPDYPIYADRLRREWAIYLQKQFTDREWYLDNIAFLEKHRYFTAYGQDVLEAGKQQNIRILKEQLSA